MRLPIRQVYRAFPELDRFSDAQCEAFITRARKGIAYASVARWTSGAVFLALVACCITQLPLMAVVDRIVFAISHRRDAFLEVAAVSVAMWVGIPALAGLIARDIIFRRRLREIIWRNIERIRCPHCRYSLLGQHVGFGEQIRCPECGGTTTLAALGLASADELMPPANAQDALPHARNH
jgi:hypothetical protein